MGKQTEKSGSPPSAQPSTPNYHRSIASAGGRRFILVMGAGIVYTALLWFGKLDGNQYVTLQIATVAAYLAANTYQKTKETTDA